MKIKPEHYAILRSIMAAGLPLVPSAEAYSACDPSIPRIHLSKDRAMRHRWDAMWAGTTVATAPGFPGDAIYTYANDEPVDTALRAIVRELAK